MRGLLLPILLLVLGATAGATCFPPGHMMPQSTDAQVNAINHHNFDKAIDRVYAHYAPIVKAKGFNLKFRRLWSDNTVNSDTDVEGQNWVINAYGGLARYPGMSSIAAYANVACHELGHFLRRRVAGRRRRSRGRGRLLVHLGLHEGHWI